MRFNSALQNAVPRIPRRRRLLGSLAIQAAIPAASLYVALLLRMDLNPNQIVHSAYWQWMPVLVILRLATLFSLGTHRGLWRYVSVPDLISIIKATTISTLIFGAAVGLIIEFEGIPRSTFLIEWGTHIFLAGGLRISVRVIRERLSRNRLSQKPKRRVVIVGAGNAGAAFCTQVRATPDFSINPVAFVDDDATKIGMSLIGVPVIGTIDDIPDIVAKHEIDLIVIAIPTATPEQKKRIVDHSRASHVEFRILPGTDELLEGNFSISKLRRVDVTDLLGRPETHLDEKTLRETFAGNVVLITGAAGTIGSELARRVIEFQPAKLILIDHSENPLVLLDYELNDQISKKESNGTDLQIRIADITNPISIRNIMNEHGVDVVLHTAAHKHVYLMEDSPADAVTNNVGGALNVARAAGECGASTFILVSTDKAVSPSSVMGATKRMAELGIRALGSSNSTQYIAVRFGNVIGSNASVVPIFHQQIESGGPVTVTHPDANRYFMTAHEAAGLILMAAAIGKNQEIYLLNMGDPVNIDTLARTMIELSGLIPEKDIAIEYTGLKTGEKLTEILSSSDEELGVTDHEKLWLLGNVDPGTTNIEEIDEFVASSRSLTADQLKIGLRKLIPEYIPDTNS